ncbi:MAG: HAD family hydrolase [Ruminococcaceae bacterium]|nr:HAD family hydrolase [Oscillospiraceae bacterium]
MKTLYITDLDGTLLDSTPKTSEYTNHTINSLLEKGVCISYATARSLVTTKKVTKGLHFKYPLVVHNGTFIVDTNGIILHKNTFLQSDAHCILNTVLKHNLSPVVFSLIDGEQKFSYVENSVNKATQDFLDNRINDPRNRGVSSKDSLFDGELYYFTLIGDEEKLEVLYDMFKDAYQCYYQRDMYSGEFWLEITPKCATKANAVLQLKKMLGCDKIVAFGDGINDLEMFSIADECYAVENAVEILKEKSTAIIENNNCNGVAKWLLKHT